MPGVTQCESQTVLAKASPSKKSRLSLRFFQKKETKRALDFTENPPAEIQNEENEPEIDQVVPAAQLSPPVCCAKKENLIPFVGFNNLGNTCYLNSILQVLCYCPGFKRGVTHLSDIITKKKGMLREDKERTLEEESTKEPPASYEVICSLSSLIRTVEHLQLSFLSNPDNYDSELAAQPRRLLNTLRELNPMYEGYLQHDAQEVLQCILGNIQEACQALKNETSKTQPGTESSKQPVDTAKPQPGSSGSHVTETGNGIPDGSNGSADGSSETNENGKRKSDDEVGNAKKKTKLTKEQTSEEHRLTRSKRKSASEKPDPQADPKKASANSDPSQKKSKLRLNWLRSSKQPSILSKFCNLGKHTTTSTKTETGVKSPKPESEKSECNDSRENDHDEKERASVSETETKPSSPNESTEFELVEKLFQGQLVLRTRCLECESFTERREDFQDISVPVQENEPDKVQDASNISPEPRMETKSLKWAISQFASVERIVGEDKYFCENCHHYTEAERSLLFDKIPEIVTIHLKCFAANSSEFDTYGGLSKVTTPLLTPLTLSLEEWSTKPSKDLYGLFAVVMHSGVTISSGHYTAYVKITDLRELDVDQVKAPSDPQGEIKTEPLTEDEARAADETYDDEVFCRVGGSTPGVCKVTKKSTDAVGLLGGQKTKSDFEHLTNKTTRAEKLSPPLIGDKPSDALNSELQPESEGSDAKTQVAAFSSDKTAVSLLQSLKEYEGQWLLFDDSEVKVTEERDFLDTISPTTTSTSTPYLLFYKKIAEQ
ncbi:ubiquitin carboxyl-terminal hydrolase 1 isoform X2 [Spea bombifrons]|uniref:ubiquitin carboxyl-terminal hydrolase 1 isoform X2 n=1 Tax=Spea bombifrons TaxID=233779 RepID=UPI00234B0933|nr:ubiquitin carboxyl-terminal hydrolase 1 isoform X2 [Spea bombifrons]